MSGVRERQGRGVYRAWFTMDGHPVFYAVTSAGEILKRCVVLRPGLDKDDQLMRLHALLDRVDPPRPRLALVKGEPRRQITVEQIDELYRNADRISLMLWRRKRAAMRGQLRRFQ